MLHLQEAHMSITKYKAFLKVAELGSLTKAAQALGYSQPNISHMIKTLENEFGFSLFIRSKDSCTLTKNAESILYYCTQIVKNDDLLHASVQGIFGLLTGSVRIGATSSNMIDFVPKAIHRFTTSYSGIELLPRELGSEDIIRELKLGNIDVGFLDEQAVPTELKKYYTPLFKDPICVILPPNHPLTSYDKIPVDKIKGCDFILPIVPGTDDTSEFSDIIQRTSPNIRYKAASDLAIFGMVENNLGISIMSKEMTKYLRCNVESREFTDEQYRIQGVLTSSHEHITPAVQEFISVAKTVELD